MSDLEKAARLAMEAICGSGDFLFNFHDCEPNNEREMQAYQAALAANEKAFNALRQALNNSVEQPAQQEPVGQLMEEAYGRGQVLWFDKPDDLSMLYTSPPANTNAGKPWVGLDASDYCGQSEEWFDGALAAEAKLKEKNT